MSYQFTRGTPRLVKRLRDGVVIPDAATNSDRIEFQAWLDAGGVVLPADPPPPPTREEMEAAAVRADPNLIALRDSAPDAVRAYIDSHLANLATAQGQQNLRDDMKTLSVAVGILARRL